MVELIEHHQLDQGWRYQGKGWSKEWYLVSGWGPLTGWWWYESDITNLIIRAWILLDDFQKSLISKVLKKELSHQNKNSRLVNLGGGVRREGKGKREGGRERECSKEHTETLTMFINFTTNWIISTQLQPVESKKAAWVYLFIKKFFFQPEFKVKKFPAFRS